MGETSAAGRQSEKFSEFARRLGVRPSYVTELRRSGRLVLTDDNRVDVEASLARIQEAMNLNDDDACDRHCAERLQHITGEGEAPAAPASTPVTGKVMATTELDMYLAVTEARALVAAGQPLMEASRAAAEARGVAYRAVLDYAAAAIEGCNIARRHYAQKRPEHFGEGLDVSPSLEQELLAWHAQRRRKT